MAVFKFGSLERSSLLLFLRLLHPKSQLLEKMEEPAGAKFVGGMKIGVGEKPFYKSNLMGGGHLWLWRYGQKISYLVFPHLPTCQVRVSRFYQSCIPPSASTCTSASSTANSSSQWALLDLSRSRSQWALPDLSQTLECQNRCQVECQKECQRECQKECENLCQKKMSE